MIHSSVSSNNVSVVVLNWNGLHFLGACLESLMRQTWADYEVIVVDNGSTDGSIDYVRTNFPSVKLIENRRNLGFAQGNNIGFQAVLGDYVIALNNDARVPRNFVEVLVKCASSDPQIGSVGCRIIQEDGTLGYGPLVTNNGILVPLFMGSHLIPKRIGTLFGTEGYCIANCAAAVLYKKRALEETGGFDSDFWSDWEDHDLGYRLMLAGYKNPYTTETSVVHVGGGSFGRELSKDRNVRIIRNMLFTYLKNYQAWNLVTRFFVLFWVVLPLRHVLSIIVYELRRLRNRPPRTAALMSRHVYLSLPEAYISFLWHLRTVMRKRVKVQTQRKVSDSVIFSETRRGWIV
jgi:GT2 family glycosyltransferase